MGKKEYTYVYIHKSLYLNVNLKWTTVFWLLLFNAKSFYFLDHIYKIPLINKFVPIVRIIRVLEITYLFIQKKRLIVKCTANCPKLSTGVNGHCLLTLRQGEYKIINFKNNEVVTIFPEKINLNDVKKQVENILDAQSCTLAPKVISWDLRKRYVVEDYINYKILSYSKIKRQELSLELFPLLKEILTSSTPEKKDFEIYFQDLCKRVYEYGSSYFENDKQSTHKIFDFVSYLQNKYDSTQLEEVSLVFSHGDFCDVNILKSNNEIRVIDWSTLGRRSCFFDLYFLLFIRYSRVDGEEQNKLSYEIEEDLQHFSQYLRTSVPFLGDLSFQSNYRYLFYLEFLSLRLEELLTCSDKPIDLIMWIELFEKYEQEVETEAKVGIS